MFLKLALIGLLVVGVARAAPRPNSKDGNFKLIILHNNDMHARFEQTGVLSDKCTKTDADANLCYGGFARVATEVKKYKKQAADGAGPPVLYLNAGDTYTGTPWFTLFKDVIASDMLNHLHPDAIVS
jgi:5'-nucleotidase